MTDPLFPRQLERLERILDRLESVAGQIGGAGGPPPFIRVRFFDKTNAPASNVQIEVEDEGGTVTPVVGGANAPPHKVTEPMVVPPYVSKVLKVLIMFQVGGQQFDSGWLPTAGLVFIEELHIDLHFVNGNYEATYSAGYRKDTNDPMKWEFLDRETHP